MIPPMHPAQAATAVSVAAAGTSVDPLLEVEADVEVEEDALELPVPEYEAYKHTFPYWL